MLTMKFIKIYLIIHIISALFLFSLGGAFNQYDLSQINAKEYQEVFNQRIRKVTVLENYESKQCPHASDRIVFLNDSKIIALVETKKADINIKANIIIQEINEADNYTYEKSQKSTDILNGYLKNINLDGLVCVETLTEFPNHHSEKKNNLDYFKLILTEEKPVLVNKGEIIKNILIDFIFAPVLLLGYLFLMLIGFHIP